MRFLLIIFFFFSFFGYSQEPNSAEAKDVIYETDKIVFYGLDFSKFKLVNGVKIHKETEVLPYISAWQMKFGNGYWVTEFDLNELFDYKVVKNDYDLQGLYVDSLKKNWIVPFTSPWSKNDIMNHIKGYNIESEHKIGLVILVESFTKLSEAGLFHYVFFDIQNKNMLWEVRILSGANRAGMTNHWFSSIFGSYKKFKESFKSERRMYKKRAKKKGK